MRLLEYLRNQAWYKPVVTSWIFRLTLRVFPRRVSYRLLKRLGPVEVKIRVGPHRFWIVTSSEDDHYLEALIGGLRGWETESLKTWAALCSRGGTVVDVGAYGGVYTALAIASGAEHVISYEPNPVMFRRLEATVQKNRQSSAVTPRMMALSDRPGSSTLLVLEERKATSGAHLRSAASDPNYTWSLGPEVKVATLEGDLQMLGFSAVTALKIDVEGLEPEVLIGAGPILQAKTAALIVESLSVASFQRVSAIMGGFGYERGIPLDGFISPEEGQKNRFEPGNFVFYPGSVDPHVPLIEPS